MRPLTRRPAAVLLALVALLTGLTSSCSLGTAGLTGAHGITVTAYFNDTAGLFVGNDVGVLGVPVGTVRSITPDGTQVKVVLQLDGDQPVPADAGAVVVARSVATDRYVELTPVYDGGPQMADGATIPVADTRTPVEFDDVLAALNRFATGISGSRQGTQAIRRIIASGDRALSGRGPLLHDTITRLSGAVGSLAGQRGELADTLRSLDLLVGTIARNQRTAGTFVSQVSRAATILDDNKVALRTALRSFDAAVTTLAGFARRHRSAVVKALGTSSDVMRAIVAKQRQLVEVLDVMPLALQNLELAGRGARIGFRSPLASLLPFGQQLQALCDRLPTALCSLINGTDPTSGLPGLPGLPGLRGARR